MCYTGKCPHELHGSPDVNGACGYKGDLLKDCPVSYENCITGCSVDCCHYEWDKETKPDTVTGVFDVLKVREESNQ